MGTVTPSAGHQRACWFYSLPFLILPILISSCCALPNFYQVNLRLKETDSLLELRCPLYQAMSGDVLVFSDMNDNELLRVVLQERKPAPILALPVERLNKGARAFVYFCRVFESKTHSLVSKTTFLVQKQMISNIKVPIYETFYYEPEEVTILKVDMSRSLKVECPVGTGKHQWFRAGGEQLLDPHTKDRLEILHFTSIRASDLGIYYCGPQPTSESHSSGFSLPVKKFIIKGNENSVLTRKADVKETNDHRVVYTCDEATKILGASDMVSWERPLGVVHLVHSGKHQVLLKTAYNSEQPYTCSIEGLSIQPTARTIGTPLVRSRRSVTKPQFILREVSASGKTATVECRWEGNGNVRFEWYEEGQGVIGTEALQDVTLVGILARIDMNDSDAVALYSCSVYDDISGEKLGENTFNGVTKFKQPDLNSVELSDEPDEIIVLYPDEQLELHCDIPTSAPFRGRDIDWYINGEKLGRVPNRVDMSKSSILGFTELSTDKTGTYSCRYGETTMATHMIVRERTLSIKIEPKEDYKSSGINDAAEFHCRVTGIKNGGKNVRWSFIPEGATEEQDIPEDAETSSPSAAPATAFLYINNPEKRHEGQYLCRIRQVMDVGKLIVEDRKISVNPETVTTRAGSTVRFFCSLTLSDGRAPLGGVTKVSWIRMDRKPLTPGREEIIAGTTSRNAAVLVVKSVDNDFNGVTYVCTDGFREAQAKILLQEVCGPGERSCGGDKCIPEMLFCNGVPDCPDGSDEIPERCRECEPNQYACLAVDGKEPSRFCYLRSWHCDGEDDCGNGFDEINCPAPNPDTPCSNKYFICPENQRPIPRSYLCDSQTDCEPSGSDEIGCSLPSVIFPSRGQDVMGIRGTNVTLKCVVHGRPPPTISWRFNWGSIKTDVDYVENVTVEGCDRVTSYLTLINIDPRASGMYTCEAVTYQNRILAPDYTVNVGAGSYCTQPKFNDAAWNEDMCLDCYCSGVSDVCTSLRGYSLAPTDKMAKPSVDEVELVQYDAKNEPIPGEPTSLQLNGNTISVTVPEGEHTYLEGTFGLGGDWTTSYSLFLKANIELVGPMEGYRPFAAIILEGNGQKIYYCGASSRPILYTDPSGYQNHLQVRLTERDGWVVGEPDCRSKGRPPTREEMMKLLSNVEKISFRVNQYEGLETYKLGNVRLEHVVPTDSPGALNPEIESCKCPEGYKGLSCQQCERGYEHDPEDPTKCRLVCACEECDAEGNCITCPNNAAGPDCSECQVGFYRPLDQPITSPCLPCEKCGAGLPHVSKECKADPTLPDGYRCRCEVREDGRLLDESCDLCKTLPSPPPEAKCDERSELLNLCNPVGTESITSEEICTCKEGYQGDQCKDCSDGFMKYGNKCLPCYCAGTTKLCRGSETHYFENVSLANPGRYKFDIFMSRKLANGEIVPVPLDETEKQRIERVYSPSNTHKVGPPEDLIIREPLTDAGVSQISIKLSDNQRGQTESDLPVYRSLYGGKMSFRFKRVQDENAQPTVSENQLIVMIESTKFGTVWTTAAFNPSIQRYEVVFSEDWWNGGWRAGNAKLSRAALMRVLGTANSIGISVSSSRNGLKNARISGLSLEIAHDFASDATIAKAEGLAVAPVEICECGAVEGRSLSPSCEGCTDLSKSTVVNIDPSGSDFQCGECKGPDCEVCPSGQFKYDFLTNTVYDSCQKGVETGTEGRVVVVEPGSRISLNCRATSYRGGIPIHTWRLPAHVEKSPDFSIRRELLPFKPRSKDGEWSPITSEAQLQIENVKEEYSGLYECQVAALGGNLTEPFYLIIRDPAKEQPTESGDTLNEEFPVPMPVPSPPPYAEYLTADPDEEPDVVVIKGKISPPSSLDDFHIVWLTPNGTQITPVGDPSVDPSTGEFSARLPVNLDEMDKNGGKIYGFLVGKDPIKTPIWVPLPEPTRTTKPATPEDMSELKLNHPFLNLSFLEPAKIQVLFPKGKPQNIQIKWRRLNGAPTESSDFPPGMEINRKGDLIIYAAGEEHEGTYEATVTLSDTGDVIKLLTRVTVEPWSPPSVVQVPPGQAGEVPEEVKGIEPPQPEDDGAFVYYVTGFTPDSVHCEHPRWTLVDQIRNTSKDISEMVNRESESKFIINYPLSGGKYIKFECLPVPTANISGSLHFDIDSSDIRTILMPVYDDPYSIFPTRLICAEGNPDIKATVKITSDSLDKQEIESLEKPQTVVSEHVELDWRRVGGFQPSRHAVKYTCTVHTPAKTDEKSIVIEPRPQSEVLEISERPEQPKLRIFSPGRILIPQGDDQYLLDVREGQNVQIVAEYDAPSDNGEITWSLDDSTDVPEITTDEGHSWKRVSITDAPTIFDGKILKFAIKTPEGEKKAQVTLGVSPSDRPFAIINLKSSAMVNGDLVGLTRGNMDIDVEAFDPEGNELPKDLETFWRIAQVNGAPLKLDDGVLAERYTQPSPSRLELQGLPNQPTEFRISAAVVVPMGETKELFTSVPYRLIVREGLIKLFVHGLTEPGILSGTELDTVGATCIARDIWRNSTVEDVSYDWDYIIQPEGDTTRLPTSTNKIEPDKTSQDHQPWSALTLQGNSIYMGSLRSRPGWTTHLRCRAKPSAEDQPVVSEWFKLNVIPGDMAAKFPKLEIRSTFDSGISSYPVKVVCVDTNTDVPSTVTWSKDGHGLPQSVKVETRVNEATLSWSVNELSEFAPRELAGVYTCEATNEFRTSTERLFLPFDIMEKNNQEKVPISKEHIRIKSMYTPIEEVDGKKQITVDEGEKFELVCEYYGHPPPAGGISWRLNQEGGEGSTKDALAKVNGLVWERGRNYWAMVHSDDFNQYAPQTGVYTCEALDEAGRVLASDSVTAYVTAKDYDVRVEGLNNFGVLYLQPGGNGRVSCRVIDSATGEVVQTFGRLKKLEWEGPMLETADIRSLKDLARNVYMSGEDLNFQGVHADLPEGMKGKCVFSDGKVTKESKPFPIIVIGEGGTDGKVKTIVERLPSGSPDEYRFQCFAFETFEDRRLEDAIVSWHFTTPSGNNVLLGHLFKTVTREGNMIVMTGLRDDISFPALSGGDSVIEGRCVAFIPETNKEYPSRPFFTIGSRETDETPEVIGRPETEEDKPIINIEGDEKGDVIIEKGKDVSLKCRLEEITPDSPHFNEGYTYNWQIARKDGRPVDTSVVADNIEVIPLPGGGLELKLTGLKASAAGLEAKCFVRNETDHENPEAMYFPKGGDSVTFIDSTPEKPDGKPQFVGISEFATIPENDRRNKYTVTAEGLDDESRLAAPLNSDLTLKVKVLDKETGEEVPITDPSWKAAGLEVQYADGRPAPLSVLADEIHVDSNTGEIKLVGYKGDSDLNKADDLFLRLIVEKAPTEIEDGMLQPGQLGDPAKERYASPLIPVTVTDKEEPDKREKARKLPRLMPIVHGLSKCYTVPLESGKDITLSCRPRGDVSEDDLIYAWELRTPQGRQVPMDMIAKSVSSVGNRLIISGMKTLKEGENLLGSCVIARKKLDSEKYFSRNFLVGPLCDPIENEVASVREIPSDDPDQRRFRCMVTKRTDGSLVPGVTYNWEFSTPSGDVILPGHLFESVEVYGDSVALGKLRTDVDISKYFGIRDVSILEGRCVAFVPPQEYGDEPKKIFSDPMMQVTKDDETGKSTYSEKVVIDEDKPRVAVIGAENDKVIVRPGDDVRLKCVGIDDQTGANLRNIDYLWEIQAKDGRPIDSSALAEKVELMPASDGSGYELKLIKLRPTANELRLRCVLKGVKSDELLDTGSVIPLGPEDQVPGDFVDIFVEDDPSKPESVTDKLKEIVPIPDDDPRKPFRVEVKGLDPNGNLAAPQNSTVTIRAELIDEFTNEKVVDNNILFGLEVTNADGTPASLNFLADFVEVDGKTGEIKLMNYQADRRNSEAKDIRLRVVADRMEQDKRQRFASPYFYPVLIKDDGEPIEDNRPTVKVLPELRPLVVGLSDCLNLPIEVGARKTLICDVSSPSDDLTKLLYGWELRDEKGNELPLSGSIADFATQSGNRLELVGLFKPSQSVFGLCVVARPDGDSSKYYSDYFEIGGICEPAPETLIKVDVQEVPRHDPEEKVFECYAYDAAKGNRLENATFSWQFRSVDTGEVIPPALLFSKVKMEGKRVTLSRLRADVDLVTLTGSQKVYGECIAYVPRGSDGLRREIYYSGPKFFIEKDPSGAVEMGKLGDIRKEKIKFNMMGIEDGKVMANEGDNKVISCIAEDSETRRPVEGLHVQWVFEYQDGTVEDTSTLAQVVKSAPLESGAALRLQGIYKTASGLRAKCIGVNARRGLDKRPEVEDGPLDPNEVINSPYIGFEVTSKTPDTEDAVAPKPELLTPKDFKIVIDGLDQDGNLAISRGSNAVLNVKLIDSETGEELPKTPDITYGVELTHADKSSAALGVLAKTVEMDSENGQLKIEGYHGDALSEKADDLFLKFTVKRPTPMGDGTFEKFVSKPISVKTLDRDGKPVSDNRTPALSLPDLKPIVLGLSKCSNLEYDEGDNVTLKCKARGLLEDDDSLIYAWEVIKPGGSKISMVGTLSESVEQEGSKLRLMGMHVHPDVLFGRCLIARKAGNGALYGSKYFRIGGKCEPGIKTVVKVDEIPTLSSHERKFKCKSVDFDSGRPIQAGNFIWEFVTSSGEVVLPSHIFSKVEIDGDTIQLSRPIPGVDLSKFLGPNDGNFIIGRCRVIKSDDMEALEQPSIPPSDAFIVISATKDDEGKIDILEPIDAKDEKPDVIVKGADDNQVNRGESDSVTLTCEAQDAFTRDKVNGLTYAWEIRTKDNRPVDTSALADSIELLPTGEIKLTGLKQSAIGLRVRCVLINGTSVDDKKGEDQGVLSAGEAKPGHFIDFNVRPDPSSVAVFDDLKSLDIDTTEPPKYKVTVEGLDDNGALSSRRDDKVTIKGRLINIETGEEETHKVRFGIETSYADGSPAPVGILGDGIRVDSKTGEVRISAFKGDLLSPQQDSLRIRFVAEKITESDELSKPVIERYASKYIPVVVIEEDGSPIKGDRPTPEKFDPVRPTVEGLSPCGNLVLQQDYPVSVYCKAAEDTETESQFVYGWEFFNAKGSPIPLAGLLSSSAVVEGSTLRLTDAKNPVTPVFGRCVVARKAGDDTRYFSPLFQVGGECDAYVTTVPVTTTKAPSERDMEKPSEGEEESPEFTGTTSDKERRIRFQLTGINFDRIVLAKPGENATLTCTAYDADSNEIISDATISWEFSDLEQNKISPMRIANKVTLQGENAINFINLRKEPKAGGRCLITFADKATISTPFFYFHIIEDEKQALPVDKIPNGEAPIEVIVEGLNEHGQIAVKQIGDDAQLTCKAIRTDTNEILADNVRYGWEWRYLDNDPAMTSNVAVGIKTDGDSMELRGIRAPEGLGGRGIKGRCVLHIPVKYVDPSAADGDKEHKFTSSYFIVVVDRVPVVSQSPIPGHPVDGITVEIGGVDNGELKASQGSDAKLDCIVKNITSGKPISAALYAIVYGWEFRDASGDAVDSSYFANAVNIEPHGSLKLSQLSAPVSGRFPMRIRCSATLARRLPTSDRDVPQPRIYNSDYVGLFILRDDGTITAPQPGQPEPDLQGNRVDVSVKGLHRSGDLESMPGEDVELTCVATDKKTDRTISSDQAIFDWSLVRSNGQKLSNGQVAEEVSFDGPRMILKHVRLMDPEMAGSMGRCEVFYNGQMYSSQYFKMKFTPKHPDEQIEGDGVLVVDIEGVNKALGVVELTPEEKTLRCFAFDLKTRKPETDLSYDWEYYMSQGEGLPNLPDVMDPERVETFKEGLSGKLTLKGTDNRNVPSDKMTRLRCRVTKGGISYTSPYFSIRLANEEVDAEKLEEKPVPKYWARVTGLDSIGQASADPGETIQLECQAMDTKTGKVAENVDYLWEVRSIGGRMVDVGQISSEGVSFQDSQMILRNVKPNYGTMKGRCIIVDRETKEHFPSPFFNFAVPPTFKPEDIEDRPRVVSDAAHQDDRIKVWVTELNGLGNLNGLVGQDALLRCNAEPQVANAEVFGYSWEFIDEHAQSLSPSVLAKDVQANPDGTIQMNGLRAYKDHQGYHAVGGRCLAYAKIINEDGREEQLRFPSKYFHVIVRDTKEPFLPKVSEDLQGEFIIVEVDGLDERGNLKAEPGDTVTLKCKAKDVDANTDEVIGAQSWEFVDSLGREVSAERLAMSVEQTGRQLTLRHLRPTPVNVITRGKCVVFSDRMKRIYSSVPFDITVKRRDLDDLKEGGRVAVEVTGDIADNRFLGLKGGDSKLYCSAKYTNTGEAVSPDDASYDWEFEINGELKQLDAVGGVVAAEAIQAPDPENPQAIMLQLNGLSASTKWTKARCRVTVSERPKEDGDFVVVETYYSPFFTSGSAFDPTTFDGHIVTDPEISIRVLGLDEENTLVANVGDDRTLKCSAIDMTTGLPIENTRFTWDIRTVDDLPLTTNRLADQVRAVDGELQLFGLKESSKFARARCLATLPPKDDLQEGESKKKLPFYASPIVKFQVTPREDEPLPTEPKIDISNLKVEVHGISPSGTLTDVAGNNRTLDCIVTDKWMGAPIVEGISVGWVLATGPDNQPFELSRLADNVEFDGSKLILTGLRRTGKYSGGLRGQCIVSAEGIDTLEVPVVKSDVFAIHISPEPSVDPEGLKESEDEKDEGLPDRWLPGPEPKDAVVVIIHELNRDGEFEGSVGADATLTCVAHDTKTQQQLKVGSPNDRISPHFSWELRDRISGEQLSLNQLASGQVTMTQTAQGVDSPDASAASRLRLEGLRSTIGKSLHGRCTVSLNGQRYRSAYFPISIGGKRIPGSVVTVEDISGYYETDSAVTVVVSELNPDGGKVVHSGGDVTLKCTAMNSKSKIPLSEKSVFYGWRLVNAEGHELPPESIGSIQAEGDTLTLSKVSYTVDENGIPEPIYGWCVAGVKRPTGLFGLQRYRSDTFIIHPDGEEAAEPVLVDRPDIMVSVVNIGGDEDFLIRPGEDIEMVATVTDAKTGETMTSRDVKVGWQWTDVSGTRPISLSEFAAGGEELTPEGRYNAYNVRLSQPVRGRAIVTYRAPGEGGKWIYTSPYFFLSPDREFVPSEGEEAAEEIPFEEANDGDVILKVTGLNDKGQFIVPINGAAEISVVASDAVSGKVLTKETEPALVGYGWDVVNPNGLPSHSGDLADAIKMDTTSGKLIMTNLQPSGQQVLVRLTALVDAKKRKDGEVVTTLRKRYKSDPIPVLSEGDTWPEASLMDLSAKDVVVTIEGVDENNNVVVNPGENVKLKAVAKDTSGADVKVNGYSWAFIDRNGYSVAPSLISKSSEESADGTFKFSIIQPSAMANGVRGRCRVAVEREGVKDPQYYESPWFSFKSPVGEEARPTDGPGVPTDEREYGFTLKVKSGSSVIYPSKEGDIVMARPHLPLELDCIAEFPEGVNPRLSETGVPIPQLSWYYRRPEIPGDVPIPAELYRVDPGKLEALLISEIGEHTIRISSDHYDFSDDVAEFQCHAMDGEKTLTKHTVFINRVKERIRVQVFDENSRMAVYALENSKTTLSCYVEDELYGGRVDPLSYKWEVKRAEQNWNDNVKSGELATRVEGVNDKDLILDGLLVSEADQLSTSYQLRCVAQYNETYFAVSRAFAVNVHRIPELKSIRLIREKPEYQELGEPGKDVYDAGSDYLVSCKPDFSAGEVQAVWEKYDAELDDWEVIRPPPDKLFFVADSTEYQDEGLYRCRVNHNLQDYDYHVVKTRVLELRRIAGPAPSSRDHQTFTVNDELMLQCNDLSASPEVEVEWSFKPSGEAPPEGKDPLSFGSYFQHERSHVFIIPRGQLLESHSGTYTCTRTNEHGQATTTITVTVKPADIETPYGKRT